MFSIVVDFSCGENWNKCIKYGFQFVALVIWGDGDGNVEYGPDDDDDDDDDDDGSKWKWAPVIRSHILGVGGATINRRSDKKPDQVA